MSTNLPDLIKILIVDDDEDDFVLLKELLEKIETWAFQLDWIPRYEEAIDALLKNAYTICFTDYFLGARNGIDLIKEIQQTSCTTPVILLTGKGNRKIDQEATRAGAFDYLVKDEVDEDKLERTIRYTLERSQTVEQLMASERRYRSFFEKSIDVVFIAREDTTITTINPAVTELLQYPVAECIANKKLLDFFKDERVKTRFTNLLVKHNEVENFEAQLVSESGEIVSCLINASLEANGSDPQYIQGIIHNITDIKKVEAATLQTEKLAATGRFIHTMAHEVRNPLKNIKMAVQQLQNPTNRVDGKILLDIVDRSEVKIDTLITELLQSSNAAVMTLKSISLDELADELVAAVQDKATLRKITVTAVHKTVRPVMIQADLVKLRLAITNIIVNAIEAVPAEAGVVSIISRATNGKAELLIKDNGVGISPENKAKLFEPYFTSKRTGIGLGLATTLNIMQAHHAHIEVDSEPGKGSTFKLIFEQVVEEQA
ncbi:MAG: response regulator [Ferruginibacter sp.]|nr:response regulator [Ferruginibacter sp.]